jgi:hypothetical protein
MRPWFVQWHLGSTGPGSATAWMKNPRPSRGATPDSHPSGVVVTVNAEGLMPGMASGAELDRLRHATSLQLDLLYYELMTCHHLGGIAMIGECWPAPTGGRSARWPSRCAPATAWTSPRSPTYPNASSWGG